MKVVEVLSVAPTLESQELPTQTSLPFTFFDIIWLRLPPVERIFFYEFPHPTPLFFDALLPKLKHSLPLALAYFLPLSGHLTWPFHSKVPIISYNTGDTVALTVAESDADFNHLSGTDLCEAKEIHHLIPHLNISHEKATVLALQITLFPNSGFSIGITSHHAVLDGKTSTSFIKSWAYLCRESPSPPSLPPQLTPFYDREVVKDPYELEAKYVSEWLQEGGSNNRSLKVWDLHVPEDATRGLFHLPRSGIEKLKRFVVSKKKENSNLRLSTFVLSVAYAWVCRMRAEKLESKIAMLVLNVDCRGRLDPPLPETYFGNCVGTRCAFAETRELLGENGLIVAVEALSEALETLKDGVLSGAENWLSGLINGLATTEVKGIGVAGSPSFEVYSSDFGWGRPKKVEMASIDRTAAFCLSDSRNGDGVEIGFVSKKEAMNAFTSLYVNGLES